MNYTHIRNSIKSEVMSGSIREEIRIGQVVIGHHLKTTRLDDEDENDKEKSELAKSIVDKCCEKGWTATVHRYPNNGYCSELDDKWANPISIIDGENTYTYVIFSMPDLDGNYGSPFYKSYNLYGSRIKHLPMSVWSKYSEFTEIVKDVFGECNEIEHFVRTK